MTLGQFLIKLVKRWKLIVICIVVLGIVAYIGSILMTPIYQSTVLVQIAIRSSNNSADYNSLLASDQLVQTEANLVTSNPVLREVSSHYPGLTVQQLAKEVTSAPNVNTQLFEIDVQDLNATRAANLANDIAATLIKQQTQLAQQGSIQAQQQIQQDLDNTQKKIDDTTAKIVALPSTGNNQAQITVLEFQLNSFQQHYSEQQTALTQLKLAEAQNSNFLLVVQPAQPALIPVRPNVLLNTAAGLFAGLLLAMALVLLFEQLDTRISSPELLSQLLDWPVLATISQAEPEEVVNPVGNNANIEAYRILRTNIGFSSIDKALRTILVTSATIGDGKSVVSANLAIFMAKAGKNTLLIDADFRCPRQHEQFNLPAQSRGFSDAILAFTMPLGTRAPAYQQFLTPAQSMLPSRTSATSSGSLDPFFYAVDIPNLRIMPSGLLPPHPPELLDSKAMQNLLTALDSCGAEVVIFDAPPLLGLSDASILASKADGTLLVVDITRASRGNLKQVKAMLAQAGAHVLGAVVNKQHRRSNHSIYSYYPAQEENSLNSENGQNWHAPPVTPVMHTPPTTPVMHTPPATPVIWNQPETQSRLNMREW